MSLRLGSRYVPLLATLVVALALYAAGCLTYPNFGSLRVLVSLLSDNAFLGVAAIGATFVILSGGIDLSVGAVVAFVSTWLAVLIGLHGVHPAAAIISALALGTLFGAAMGTLIHVFRIPAFLVTLAGMFLARGLAFVIHPQSLAIKHPFFMQTVVQDLAIPLSGRIRLPFVAVCFVVWLLMAVFLAHYTRWGRAVYAVGGDEQSAQRMGLPVGRTRILVYAFAGLCSALAGVVYTFYTLSGNPAACVGFELDAIAATVIGGTLLSGGVGFVAGTALGVLIMGLVQVIITFQGNLSTWWTKIVIGLLMLVFILLQNMIARGATRARTGAADRSPI